MKITDSKVIENGEKVLIEAVQEDLDQDAVKEILKDRMGDPTLSSKGGQIVIHNNQIAFRLDFEIASRGSLLFDREGNHIDEIVADTVDGGTLEPETKMEPKEVDADATSDGITEESQSDEIPLVDTGFNETNLDEQGLDGDLSIDLPESDLGDETKSEDKEDLSIQPLELETDDLLSDEPDLPADDPAIMAESNDFATEDMDDEELLSGEMLDDEELLSEEMLDDEELLSEEMLDDEELLSEEMLDDEELLSEEMLDDEELLSEETPDDGINDILKESRDFWEQKK